MTTRLAPAIVGGPVCTALSGDAPTPFVLVALSVPVRQLVTYRVPDALDGRSRRFPKAVC